MIQYFLSNFTKAHLLFFAYIFTKNFPLGTIQSPGEIFRPTTKGHIFIFSTALSRTIEASKENNLVQILQVCDSRTYLCSWDIQKAIIHSILKKVYPSTSCRIDNRNNTCVEFRFSYEKVCNERCKAFTASTCFRDINFVAVRLYHL